MVSKLRPTKLGSRNVFLEKSHVPSPTVIVLDEYELDPGGDKVSAGAMTAMARAAAVYLAPDRGQDGAMECGTKAATVSPSVKWEMLDGSR